MPNRPKSPSPQARDQNLSKILETITDDGPARPEAEKQRHAEEGGYASLIEKAYRKSRAQGAREPAATPAKAPPEETTPKRRSWRRELTIAGITGAAAIVALIALYAPWGIKPSSQTATNSRPVENSNTDLKTIQRSSTLLSKRVDELSTESDRAVQQLDQKLSGEHETTRQRLSALEQRVAQMGRLEAQLAALSSRLDRLESDVRERTSRESSMQSADEGAEVRPSDEQSTHDRGETGALATTAPAPKISSDDQASGEATVASRVDEPVGEPAVTRSEVHPSESKQRPVPETPTTESDSDMKTAADSARDQNDDLSSEKGVSLTAAEPKSGEVDDENAEDNDASQSEITGKDEGESSKKWAISLIALASKEKIQALERKYTAKGVKVEMARIGRLFALRVPGFADRAAATAYSDTVKQKLGIREVWIYEY